MVGHISSCHEGICTEVLSKWKAVVIQYGLKYYRYAQDRAIEYEKRDSMKMRKTVPDKLLQITRDFTFRLPLR